MANVVELLSSVGKKVFVDYYEDFENNYEAFKNGRNESRKLAEKLLEENSNATSIVGQKTRVNCAKIIFKNNLQKEALKIIISSDKLSEEIIKKAKILIER